MNKAEKKIDYNEILDILTQFDRKNVFEKINLIPQEDDLKTKLHEYIFSAEYGRKSVLGIDIYRYSMYEELEQTLIPVIFKSICNEAIELCLKNHPLIFQKYSHAEIEKNFISTGDGGFFIFDIPLQSLLFAINFEIILRTYNSYHFYPKLRKIIGEINIRYAITYDKIYSFDNNHYGRVIINCARILSRDSLNRCLIDQNVYEWFLINLDGIENLQIISLNDIINIFEFTHQYNTDIANFAEDQIFSFNNSRNQGIINADILKIGKIMSKETDLSIFNLHLQVTLKLQNKDNQLDEKIIIISLGNLNTMGI